jgi:glycosyltransferase involved in cell wall biosynthesis
MKLVIVGTYPLDKTTIRGGVEAVLVNLVEGLKKKRSLDIHIISCRRELTKAKIVKCEDITLHYLPASKRFGNITFRLMEKYRVKKKIDELKPDIIHFQDQSSYVYTHSRPPCPLILTIHGICYQETKFRYGFVNWVRRCLRNYHERIILRNIHNIIAVSPYVKQAIGNLTTAQMHLIANPIDDKYFELRDRSIEHRVLFAGFVSRLKNLLALIRAIALIRQHVPDVKVYVAGNIDESDYFKVIKKYIIEHALQKQILFLGHLTEKQLREEYEKCSILVLPSLQENSPIVIQQAMAAGKAVVATRVGGVPYLVKDSQTGFLVEPGDIQDLAEKIKELLQNRELREEFGKSGKLAAQKRFASKTVAEKTYYLYRELIRRYRRG